MSRSVCFLVLCLLVLVHELGHVLAAKKFGIRVDEFGIGFPPKAFGKKYGETEYTFNWLPIGGFVRIFGEDPDEESTEGPDRERSFVHKPKWQQAIVLVAGVTFNVLFAWLLFTGGFMVGMPTAVDDENRDQVRDLRLLVTQVIPDSPAEAAGLKTSDQITAITAADGDVMSEKTAEAVSAFISERGGEELTISIVRDDTPQEINVTPENGVIEDEPERAAAGFVPTESGIERFAPHIAIAKGADMTVTMLWLVTKGIVTFFADAFTLQADFTQVAGPVGIVGLVGDASALGFAYLVTFTAFISLNLAVINMLPFPALDGGRLLFVLIEKIKGSPINPAIANNLNRVGMILLVLLIVAVTYNDIIRLFS